ELAKQVEGDHCRNPPPRGKERAGIDRQILRVHVDEDRLVARRNNRADQRGIGEQRQSDAGSRLQFERAEQEGQRLPAAARPEPGAAAERVGSVRRRSSSKNGAQRSREVGWSVRKRKTGNRAKAGYGHKLIGGADIWNRAATVRERGLIPFRAMPRSLTVAALLWMRRRGCARALQNRLQGLQLLI